MFVLVTGRVLAFVSLCRLFRWLLVVFCRFDMMRRGVGDHTAIVALGHSIFSCVWSRHRDDILVGVVQFRLGCKSCCGQQIRQIVSHRRQLPIISVIANVVHMSARAIIWLPRRKLLLVVAVLVQTVVEPVKDGHNSSVRW